MPFEPIVIIAIAACVVCFGCGLFIGHWNGIAMTLDRSRRHAADTRHRLFTGVPLP